MIITVMNLADKLVPLIASQIVYYTVKCLCLQSLLLHTMRELQETAHTATASGVHWSVRRQYESHHQIQIGSHPAKYNH